MRPLIIFCVAGLVLIGLFSIIVIVGIAWTHYPFTTKDISRDIREICKAFYGGIKPRKRKEK